MNNYDPLNTQYSHNLQNLESNRQLSLIIYILYALGLFSGITAIIAIVMNYVKRDDVRGAWYLAAKSFRLANQDFLMRVGHRLDWHHYPLYPDWLCHFVCINPVVHLPHGQRLFGI